MFFFKSIGNNNHDYSMKVTDRAVVNFENDKLNTTVDHFGPASILISTERAYADASRVAAAMIVLLLYTYRYSVDLDRRSSQPAADPRVHEIQTINQILLQL